MCGLITILSKKDAYLPQAYESIFKQLLYVNALRGFDSTGVCRIDYNHNPQIEKDVLAAGSFLFKNSNKLFFSGRALLGHNRAATKGSITIEYAHPHQVDNITLIHNGTLYNHTKLVHVPSDSLAITTKFATNDPKEIIPQLEGSFALIWYDSKNKSYHWIRNDQRPLALLETKDAYVLVSESDMGNWILTRNGINVISSKEILPLDYYSFKLGEEIKIDKLKPKKEENKTNVRQKTYFENSLATELKENFISLGDIVTVDFYWEEKSDKSWKRYVGAIRDTYLEVSMFSNKDLLNAGSIKVKLMNITTFKEDQYATIVAIPATTTEEKEKEQTKKNLVSLNGIELTKEVESKLKKIGKCYLCESNIHPNDIKKSLLIERKVENRIHKTDSITGITYGYLTTTDKEYKLYCPSCVSFFSKCDPGWIERETQKSITTN